LTGPGGRRNAGDAVAAQSNFPSQFVLAIFPVDFSCRFFLSIFMATQQSCVGRIGLS
jgi:hypothetical protein